MNNKRWTNGASSSLLLPFLHITNNAAVPTWLFLFHRLPRLEHIYALIFIELGMEKIIVTLFAFLAMTDAYRGPHQC